MVRSRYRRRLGQTGSATVEMSLITPLMIWFMLTLVGMGRIALAQQSVTLASANAARAASLARTQDVAVRDARAVAEQTLVEERFSCASLEVDVAADQVGVSLGQHAQVEVTVTCDIDLGDITGFTVLPGTITATETWTSPVDVYRGE
jgi:Flp pilus assembly protein TadG